MGDDVVQSRLAQTELAAAALVAIPIPIPCLCELVWVLSRGYRVSSAEIGRVLRDLAAARDVMLDRDAVTAGLSMLDAGGDFADGAIAAEGRRLGGEVFISFDRQAVAMLNAQNAPARLLA